jgi:hypothetical protein
MKALTRTLTHQTLLVLSVLTLVLVLAPGVGAADCGESAHPSGNDRCEEPGGSGAQGEDGTQIQGDAASDPDDNGNPPERTNGGADEPGGPGGVNLQDQDGNNGCGNDQDFEDDNEGLCTGAAGPASVDGDGTPDTRGKPGIKPTANVKTPDGTRVLPQVHERDVDEPPVLDNTVIGPPSDGRVPPPPARVPDTTTRPPATDLPATGVDLTVGWAALGAILAGTLLVRRARSAKAS